jgi:hypothetical protein
VYLEGGTETAFRKAPKVGVEYDVPRLYRFYFKYGPMPAAATSIDELTTVFSSLYQEWCALHSASASGARNAGLQRSLPP